MDEDPSHYSKEVAKGSIWNLLGSGFFYMFSFLYTVLIARVVSQDDLGIFFLSLSIIQLPAVFDNLGLASSIVRYVPYFEGKKENGKIRSLLNISYVGVSLSAIVLMAIIWLLSDSIGELYQNPALPESIRLLSFLLILSNLLNLGTAYIRSRTDMRSSQIVQNLQNGLKLVFTLLLVWQFGPSAWSLSMGLILSFIPPLFLSFYYVRRRTADLPSGHDRIALETVFREIIPFGLMLGMVGSLNALFFSSGRLILGYLTEPSASAEAVAIISVSSTLASVLLNAPSSVGNIFLPIISRLYGENKTDTMLQVTQAAQRWTLLMTIPAGLVLILFSSEVLLILYGEKYLSGSAALSMLTVGVLIKVVSFMLSLTLSAMQKVRIQILVLILSGLLNVSLNFLLIPHLGLLGSAIAASASFLLSTLLMLHYAHKYFSFSLPPEAYKISLAGIVTLALMYLITSFSSSYAPHFSAIKDGLLSGEGLVYLSFFAIMSLLTCAIFLSLSLLLRCLRKEDVALMGKALAKIGIPKRLSRFIEKIASSGTGD